MVIDAQTGEAEPLSLFLTEVRPRLERALVVRFGMDDGLDAAAEAAAYAVAHWDRLQLMENPVGYLFRVGQTSGRRLSRRWNRIGGFVKEPWVNDGVADIDLQRALLRLKPDERIAVVLVYAHGHSYSEAAAVLDVPVTTVTNYLSRGLTRLRRSLER